MWQLPIKIQELIRQAHADNQRIVLVTGVFDLLHEEHKKFLEKAKAQGDVLIVGLESDERVRHLKGEGRPINTIEQRRENLSAWHLADAIFILPTEFNRPEHHEALIAAIRPAVLAVSSHTAHLDKKSAILQKFGGQVIVVHDYNPAVSTTQILAQRGTTSERLT